MNLALLAQAHYGFFAIRGFFGILLGILLMLVVLWGIFKIFDIVKAKFGNENTGWMFEIVRVVLVVFTVVWFINTIFSLFPWGF